MPDRHGTISILVFKRQRRYGKQTSIHPNSTKTSSEKLLTNCYVPHQLLTTAHGARVITLNNFFEGIILKKQSSSELITTILLTHFLWELQQQALKAYPDESQDMKDYLVLQGLLEGIHQSKNRLEMHKAIEEIHAVHSHALNLKN